MTKKLGFGLLMAIFSVFSVTNASAAGYVGGGFGKTDYDADWSTFDDPIGIELFAGADVSYNLAFEVSLIDFGESSDGIPPEWHIEASTIAVGGVLMAPINPNAEVLVKVGFHMWDYKYTEDFPAFKFEDDGTDIFYGFGAAFKVNPVFKIGLRYMIYPMEVGGVDFDIKQFSLNGAFTF